MQFLVTGSAGFIGYHVAARLLSEGHSVTGYDALTPLLRSAPQGRAPSAPRAHPRRSRRSWRCSRARRRSIAAADAAVPDIIIHLAAQAGVRYSLEAPETYASSNVVGSLNVLELARRVKPKHLHAGLDIFDLRHVAGRAMAGDQQGG